MLINVNGQNVEVDDNFKNLSQDEQQSTVEDIQNQMNLHQTAHEEQQSQPQPDDLEIAKQNLARKQQEAIDLPVAAGASAVNAAMSHPAITAAGAAAAFPKVAHSVPGVGQAMDIAKSGIDVLKDYNLNQAEHQAIQYMKNKQTPPPEFTARLNQLRQQSVGPSTTPQGPVQPTATQPTATQAAPAAAAEGELGTMNAARNIVQKLALDKVMKGAGILGAGALIGSQLMYTSPEEIAVLKAAEAKRRAQGWKPLNER
jgi:hypothetical protein